MNELALSTDIRQIEFEINHYKQLAGQSIWEIGRRLNHVKENDLAHGQFMKWLEEIKIEHTQAKRMMTIAKDIPNSATLHYLGTTALYLIATLPDEEKEQQLHKIESGESPTVRELRELKQQLKQKDNELKKKEQQLEIEKNKPAKVIEVEIVPQDYEQLKERLTHLETSYNNLLDQRAKVDEQSAKYEELTRFIQEAEGKLSETQKRIADYKQIQNILKESNEFLLKASSLTYMDVSKSVIEDTLVRREFESLLFNLKRFTNNLEKLTQSKIIEGEIINE